MPHPTEPRMPGLTSPCSLSPPAGPNAPLGTHACHRCSGTLSPAPLGQDWLCKHQQSHLLARFHTCDKRFHTSWYFGLQKSACLTMLGNLRVQTFVLIFVFPGLSEGWGRAGMWKCLLLSDRRNQGGAESAGSWGLYCQPHSPGGHANTGAVLKSWGNGRSWDNPRP